MNERIKKLAEQARQIGEYGNGMFEVEGHVNCVHSLNHII